MVVLNAREMASQISQLYDANLARQLVAQRTVADYEEAVQITKHNRIELNVL